MTLPNETNDHAFVASLLLDYLAGALPPPEYARFESHIASCAHCASLLEEARQLDSHMRSILSPLSPDASFESRLIAMLPPTRASRFKLVSHPLLRQAATATAAMLLVGLTGYVSVTAMEKGKLPLSLPGMSGERVASVNWFFDSSGSSTVQNSYNDRLIGTTADGASHGADKSLSYALAKSLAAKEVEDRFKRESASELRMPATVSHQLASQPGLVRGGDSSSMDRQKSKPQDVRYMESHSETQNGTFSYYFAGGENKGFIAGNEVKGDVPNLSGANDRLPALGRLKVTSGEVDVNGLRDSKDSVVLLRDADADMARKRNVDFQTSVHDKLEVNAPVEATKNLRLALNAKAGEVAVVQDAPVPPSVPAPAVEISRKIIRTGVANYEVESFDAAATRISEILTAAGGYISSSNSEKLPNGKVRGSIVVRMAPEKLDGVLGSLRALGELKSQNIESSDVTRQFVDTDAQLRAARAVESRLLDIIKNGKGEIKDLVAAEKELGEWRTKIETLEGSLRYLSNQVALSTLTITLTEKDIKAPATAIQTEAIAASIQSTDIPRLRDAVLAAVEAAKGRVIESQLNQQEASGGGGGAGAQITADVPQENSGAFVDRLRTLGTVTQLRIEKRQTTQGDEDTTATPKIERRLTRVTLTLLSQQALVPKTVESRDMAAADVEASYNMLLEKVRAAGANVTMASFNRRLDPIENEGFLNFDLPADKAEAISAAIYGVGVILNFSTSDNGNAANVTDTRRGFTVHFTSTVRQPPTSTRTLTVQTTSRDVAAIAQDFWSKHNVSGARLVEFTGSSSTSGGSHRIIIELPAISAAHVTNDARELGKILEDAITHTTPPTPPAPPNPVPLATNTTVAYAETDIPLPRARIVLTLTTAPEIVPSDQGVMVSVRKALATSALGLLWSLQILVIGLCLLLPWAGIIYIIRKLVRRRKTAAVTQG